jgi:type III restriction enzyme
LLNTSYVFTASSVFSATLQNIVKGLNRAGFSDKDYRITTQAVMEANQSPETDDLFITHAYDHTSIEPPNKINENSISDNPAGYEVTDLVLNPDVINAVNGNENDINDSRTFSEIAVDALTQQASIASQAYEEQARQAMNVDIPIELEDKMNKHKLKGNFRDDALALKIPQFFIHVEPQGWIEDETTQLFEKDLLLKEFNLGKADATISFEDVETELYRLDLEYVNEGEYKVTPFKAKPAERKKYNLIILKGDRDSQLMNLNARLTTLIGNMTPISEPEIKNYISRITDSFSESQIHDALERDIYYVKKIKQKINTLSGVHAHKTFIDYLDLDTILIEPNFTLPEIITPSANAQDIPKSLYSTEAAMGIFEARVINEFANLENIQWWHRNLSRGKGFWINGFINHYPDFIVKTDSGKIILIETKGDDRDNSDSELKLKLGKLWESKADARFKYMMVFDNNPIDGAERLADAINKLGQM